MQAGRLDRVIEIQELATEIDDYGTPTKLWSKVAEVRAQMLSYDATNRDGVRSSTDTTITFRIYYLAGVNLDCQVIYNDKPFKIQKIKELGRRAGLDLVVERVGP